MGRLLERSTYINLYLSKLPIVETLNYEISSTRISDKQFVNLPKLGYASADNPRRSYSRKSHNSKKEDT